MTDKGGCGEVLPLLEPKYFAVKIFTTVKVDVYFHEPHATWNELDYSISRVLALSQYL